jgi:1-deoxy-D-xylulose-5-phosphate synthase
MKRLRQKGGIAGFPRREESSYDTFGTGALVDVDLGGHRHGGRGEAQGQDHRVIAVIGDGAMTAAWPSRRSTTRSRPTPT